MDQINQEMVSARYKTPETVINVQALVDFTGAKSSPAVLALLDEWPHLPTWVKDRVKARAQNLPIPPIGAEAAGEAPAAIPRSSHSGENTKTARPNARKRWEETAETRFAQLLRLWREGKSPEEIAVALGKTPKAIQNQISRARIRWGLFNPIERDTSR